MNSIGHIIVPVVVPNTSDLVIAQPVTFETMRIACEFAGKGTDVRLFAVQFNDEEQIPLPYNFSRGPMLTRSISDLHPFRHKRKLSLIKDILDRLYNSTDAEYLIYTNVDIALQPYFYKTVSTIIDQGYDAFIINRRTIPDKFNRIEQIPKMFAQPGEKHKGWDCFVFHRSLYPKFQLGDAIIGAGWIGRVMITNMACFAKRFHIFEDFHLTFHIGNDRVWKVPQFDDYTEHNKTECKKILEVFDKKHGPFDRNILPGRFFNLINGHE